MWCQEAFQLEWRDRRERLCFCWVCVRDTIPEVPRTAVPGLARSRWQQDCSPSLRAVLAGQITWGPIFIPSRTPKRCPGNMDCLGKKEVSVSRPLDCYISSKCAKISPNRVLSCLSSHLLRHYLTVLTSHCSQCPGASKPVWID